MNLENMLSGKFQTPTVHRIGKYIKTKSRLVTARKKNGGGNNCSFVGITFTLGHEKA